MTNWLSVGKWDLGFVIGDLYFVTADFPIDARARDSQTATHKSQITDRMAQ
jgi:hypothetical protein